MPPILAPRVVRYTVNQRIGGQPVANIIDMEIVSLNPLDDREEDIFEQAGDILNNWDDHIRPFQVDDLTCESVSWLDLNSLDGSRGERSTTSDTTWPAVGGAAANDAMPAVIAMRVDKRSNGGRGTRNGRMYLSGIAESWTDAGSTQSWQAAAMAVAQDGLDAFLEGIEAESGADGRDAAMVVLHTVDGAYNGTSTVTGLTVNPSISTQVRRGVLR